MKYFIFGLIFLFYSCQENKLVKIRNVDSIPYQIVEIHKGCCHKHDRIYVKSVNTNIYETHRLGHIYPNYIPSLPFTYKVGDVIKFKYYIFEYDNGRTDSQIYEIIK